MWTKIFKGLGALLTVVFLGLIVGFLVKYQFEIYKKKHGNNMTFTDFLFDSERGR